MRRTVVAALAALALAGCSHPASGRVIAKHYEPKRTYTSCSPVGKITVCTPRTDDEDWVLTLKDSTDEWDVEVTREVYDVTSIGDTARTEQP